MITCPDIRIGFKSFETKDYAAVLGCDVSTKLPLHGHNMIFRSGNKILATLEPDGAFTIKEGYACDTYSPTIRMFGRWNHITPIPKRAGLFPAFLHDILRQYCTTPGCPWDRKFSDTAFYDALRAGGETKTTAGIYYGAVSRTLGNIWFRFHRQDPKLTIELINDPSQ